jgi:hypothetical protein
MTPNPPPNQIELLLAIYADLQGQIVAIRKALLAYSPNGAIDGVPLEEWLTREHHASSERQILNLGDNFPVSAERLQKILAGLQKHDGI